MKKLFAIFLLMFAVLSVVMPISSTYALSDQQYCIVANKAVLYELPSFSSTKLATISLNTKVDIQFDGDSEKIYSDGTYSFYKVLQYDNGEAKLDGYVLADLIVKQKHTVKTIPNFNAKTNAPCIVYYANGEEFEESEISLQKKHKLFLYEGFDKNKTFIAVCFVYENDVIYGFLQKDYISPNGVNPIIITCITLVIALLGIIFAWLFMKNKKSKKAKINIVKK